mgnify:CR=1 FL=1
MSFFKKSKDHLKDYANKKQEQYKTDLNRNLNSYPEDEDLKSSLKQAVKPEFALLPVRLGLNLITAPFKAPVRAIRLFKSLINYAHAKAENEITFAESFKNNLDSDEYALQKNYTMYATATCLCFVIMLLQIGFMVYLVSNILNTSGTVAFDTIAYLFMCMPMFIFTFSFYYKNGVRAFQIKKRDFMEPGFFKRMKFMKKLDDAFPTPSFNIISEEAIKESKRNRVSRKERREAERFEQKNKK